ncbi:unnamed protein product [Meloidogyne enterolobii]|uniref:Uncharacterized protein n=1 Tax=Meloidogyne enterolobii TaxID=390850 RepID=A0ACB0Y0N4_MELEN
MITFCPTSFSSSSQKHLHIPIKPPQNFTKKYLAFFSVFLCFRLEGTTKKI